MDTSFRGLRTKTLTHYRPAIPFRNRKFIVDLFSLVLSKFKKYHISGNLKFNNLGIFQGLKLRISTEKNPFQFLLSQISLQILLAVMG